jgi:hypothetical protein
MSQSEVCRVFLISLDDQRHCKYFERARITLTAVSSAFLMTSQDGFLNFYQLLIINGYCYFLEELKWIILQVILLMKRLIEAVPPSGAK